MQNPNPLYFDEGFAAAGRFGRLIGPQSFAICTDDSHGAAPAIQGHIPGTHMLFGGDEWWMYGPRIEPGDRIRHERMLFDYKLTRDQVRRPHHVLARRHHATSTSAARSSASSAPPRSAIAPTSRATAASSWARRRRAGRDDELKEIEKQKFEYYQSFLDLGTAGACS